MRFSTQYFYNSIIDKQFIATRHKSKKIKEEAIANPLPFKKKNHYSTTNFIGGLLPIESIYNPAAGFVFKSICIMPCEALPIPL